MKNLTLKGKLKDGYYYPILCSIHRKLEGFCIGKKLCCPRCITQKGEVRLDG